MREQDAKRGDNRGYVKWTKSLLALVEMPLTSLVESKSLSLGRNKGKVFGVGWAKTGTTTLAQCLQILGYHHLSQRLDLVDELRGGNLDGVLSVVREYDSFEDWPWIILFKELDYAFPDSKFILTHRDEQLLQRYNDHNAEVMAHFSGRPNCLLVVDWGQGDGWREICRFLQKAVPNTKFPHENRGIYPAQDPG